jgi:chemotaxis protein histidine kinase CheA
MAFAAITVISGGGYFFWEQQKVQEDAIRIAKQEAALSKKQAEEALQLAEVEKIKATEAKKEFELAQQQAEDYQKQIEVEKKLAFEAQQKAEIQSRLTLAAKEQAENEKRKADELAQQLARQSATAQRNSNATINWTGYLTCSKVLTKGSLYPDAFSKKISINTNAGKGTTVLRQNGTTEEYKLEITSNYAKIYSTGYFDNDKNRAWIIKTDGKSTDRNINTTGSLLSIDGKIIIRDICEFSLAKN